MRVLVTQSKVVNLLCMDVGMTETSGQFTFAHSSKHVRFYTPNLPFTGAFFQSKYAWSRREKNPSEILRAMSVIVTPTCGSAASPS